MRQRQISFKGFDVQVILPIHESKLSKLNFFCLPWLSAVSSVAIAYLRFRRDVVTVRSMNIQDASARGLLLVYPHPAHPFSHIPRHHPCSTTLVGLLNAHRFSCLTEAVFETRRRWRQYSRNSGLDAVSGLVEEVGKA